MSCGTYPSKHRAFGMYLGLGHLHELKSLYNSIYIYLCSDLNNAFL